jgi:hypothetical protein
VNVVIRRLAALAALALATSCASTTTSRAPGATARTSVEVAQAENDCISQLKSSLESLSAPRMDAFFSAALNGLLRCEASSGLAHVPTREVNRWLAHATGKPVPTALPRPPAILAQIPHDEAARLPYQRACSAYMERYLPASIARAGDEADAAAAFVFNALEECDSTAGFATIPPNELAAMMQAKHLL